MELNYDTYVYKIQDFGFGLCTFNICNRRMEKRKEKEAKNVLSISFLFTSSICFFHCKETIISTITVAFFKQIQFCHTFSSVCKLLWFLHAKELRGISAYPILFRQHTDSSILLSVTEHERF